ncbi:MAG TPA: hypothetical protein VIW64_07105 [Pyrinomonadaceae bacterium]|jgi:hypothetical protein
MPDLTKRLHVLRIAVAVAFLCGILISPKLWFGVGRTFPRVPLVSGTPPFLAHAELPLSILLLAALLISIFSKRSRYVTTVVVVTLLLVMLDQNRLQPWVYQYVIMFALLACLKLGKGKRDNAPSILLANQLVVALLYFWSGTQKLNWSFGHEVLPGLLARASIRPPAVVLSALPKIAVVAAVIEMIIGIGLIVRRTRSMAVVLAVALHVVVLIMLVVARLNSVVWPWNAAMMVMVVLLFWKFDGSLVKKEFWKWRASHPALHLPKAVVLVCGFLPALSLAGWWDIYLSGALYSGNAPVAVVHVDDQVRSRLPSLAQRQMFTTSRGESMLPFHEWSMAELNVPPYPETRVYRQLAQSLCVYADDPRQIELIVKERPSLIDGSYQVSRSDCAALRSR